MIKITEVFFRTVSGAMVIITLAMFLGIFYLDCIKRRK